MKRLSLVLALVALTSFVAPLAAAPRGHGGHRGSRRVIVVRPSVWWGWGYGPYWGDPYYGYGYGYGPYRGYYGYGRGYGYGYGPGANWAVVDTDVSPEAARVYLDGQYIGTADDFDGYPDYLYLRRGRYRLEFRLEGFQTRAIDVDARAGVKVDVNEKLGKIPGAPSYGSYDTPEPRGGVRRFWGKRNNTSYEITERDMYGDGRDRDRYRDDDRYRDRDRDYDDDDDYAVEERGARDDRDRDVREDEWRADRGEIERGDTRLVLDIRPADASVYLDGRYIGRASELSSDAGIAVAPGRHRLVVSANGYRERRMEIDLSRGESEDVEITLER